MKSLNTVLFYFLSICIRNKTIYGQHIWYNDKGSGDMMLNDVYIDSSASTSYYETLGWNQGGVAGGYTGIQETSEGHVFIFSLWDPSDIVQVTDFVYYEQGSNHGRFGGEGTGLHFNSVPANGGTTWKLQSWVTLATRCWNYGDHTYFALWVYNQTHWKQLVTIDYPYPSARFNYGATSFLENYGGTALSSFRKMRTRNGWKRYTGGSWGAFTNGGFDTGIAGVQGGTVDDYFFMATQAGLTATPATSTQYVTNPTQTKPIYPVASILSANFKYVDPSRSITVTWVLDATKSPQFSYLVQIYDSTNTLVKTVQDSACHLRSIVIDTASLSSGLYTASLKVQDIFDQYSSAVTSTIYMPKNTTTFPSATPTFKPTSFPTQRISGVFTSYAALTDSSGNVITTPNQAMRVPRLIDWNSDGKLDLLVGSNGYIYLHLNTGSSSSPTYGAGVQLTTNTGVLIYSGDSWSTFTLADMDGDGKKDLVVSDSLSRLMVFKNTASGSSVPSYAPSYFITNPSTNAAFVLPDRRFDIGDWNRDGLLDVIAGVYCGNVNVYLNSNTAQLAKYGVAVTIMTSQCYNWYPRMFDINNNGVTDLVRGINWGDIQYWLDPANLGLSSSGYLTITGSSSGNIKAITDGPIVDFGDLNGDGLIDMVFGGYTSSNNLYVVYSPFAPTNKPTISPTSVFPSISPSKIPSLVPTNIPSTKPSSPTFTPSIAPSTPTFKPTSFPTQRISGVFTSYAALTDSSGNAIATPNQAMRVPRLIDWNSDGKLDLLVGSNGYIYLHLNTGSSSSPTYGAGVQLTTNTGVLIYSGDSWSTFTLADMDGDGKKDLVVSDSLSRLMVFKNTASGSSVPSYAPSYFIMNPSTNAAFVLPDRRFDIGDWNRDGLLDVIAGVYCGNVNVYLNSNTAQLAQYGVAVTIMTSQCYNWYPRMFDVNNNGVTDLVRGINWGDIQYWLDPANLGLSSSGYLTITGSSSGNIKAITDGPIVDFGDLNGDGLIDMVFGGYTSSNNLYVVYSPFAPTNKPTISPTNPTQFPSVAPTSLPTTTKPSQTSKAPSQTPITLMPSAAPITPTFTPTLVPSVAPIMPTFTPTLVPSVTPTKTPTQIPTRAPTRPTVIPSKAPIAPTKIPTKAPLSKAPTKAPLSKAPTKAPLSKAPTRAPLSKAPTRAPTRPTVAPTKLPTVSPTTTKNPSGLADIGVKSEKTVDTNPMQNTTTLAVIIVSVSLIVIFATLAFLYFYSRNKKITKFADISIDEVYSSESHVIIPSESNPHPRIRSRKGFASDVSSPKTPIMKK